jgi:hypothetical protein
MRRTGGDSVAPLRRPHLHEPISEYLICRKSVAYGECIIQTSAVVARKELFLEVPFMPGLPRHQDWDWLLRAAAEEDFGLEWVWEPLLIYNLKAGIARITWRTGWIDSLRWASGNSYLTRRAFAYFIALQIAPRLNIVRDMRHIPRLLRDAVRFGAIEPRAIVLGVAFVLIPDVVRTWIAQKNLFGRRSHPAVA